MHWLRNVILDLLITVLIVVATTMEPAWAVWIVLVYTPFLLLIKGVALAGRDFMHQLRPADDDKTPAWVHHALYAVNTVVLLVYGWWWTGAQWIAIWGLSIAADRKAGRNTAQKTR